MRIMVSQSVRIQGDQRRAALAQIWIGGQEGIGKKIFGCTESIRACFLKIQIEDVVLDPLLFFALGFSLVPHGNSELRVRWHVDGFRLAIIDLVNTLLISGKDGVLTFALLPFFVMREKAIVFIAGGVAVPSLSLPSLPAVCGR